MGSGGILGSDHSSSDSNTLTSPHAFRLFRFRASLLRMKKATPLIERPAGKSVAARARKSLDALRDHARRTPGGAPKPKLKMRTVVKIADGRGGRTRRRYADALQTITLA